MSSTPIILHLYNNSHKNSKEVLTKVAIGREHSARHIVERTRQKNHSKQAPSDRAS
jgi:hypothetical protein